MHTAVLQNNHLPTSTLRATQITFVNSEASGLGLRRGFSRQLVGCDCDLQGSKAVFLRELISRRYCGSSIERIWSASGARTTWPTPSFAPGIVALLDELVFALPDNQHRTRGVPYDPFGGTAHEYMFEAGMAMSRDDDKIGFTIACHIGDYFKGGTHLDNHLFQVLRFHRLLSQFVQFLFQRLDRETLAHRQVGQVRWIRKRLDRMKQCDLCPKLLCKWHRVFERRLRSFGEINRYQDALEFEDHRGEFSSIAFPVFAAWPTCFCLRIHDLVIDFQFPKIDVPRDDWLRG
jgi:hypothetical protein